MSAPQTRLDAARRRWGLTGLTLVTETPSSRIFRADGGLCLKLVKPEGQEEMGGVPLLRWWGGDGAVPLRDAARDAMLLDWLPGAPLGDAVRAAGDGESIAGLARLIARLQAPRPGPMPDLEPLEHRAGPLLALTEGLPGRAARLCRRLLDTSPAPVPLHGDLHHDNVIVGPDGTWTVIDPKGVSGDPAYDGANLFANPVGRRDLALDPARIDRMASGVAAGLGQDRTRILGWATVHAALGTLWRASEGQETEFGHALTNRLFAALDRAGG